MNRKHLLGPILIISYWFLKEGPLAELIGAIRYLLALIELVFFGYLAWKAFRLMRNTSTEPSPFLIDAVEDAVVTTFGVNRYIHFVVSELMVLYFTFFSWFSKDRLRSLHPNQIFGYRKGSQHGILLSILCFVSIGEISLLHFILSLWNHTVAWVVTGLSIYSIVWLIGDYRAAGRSPIILQDETLLMRIGIFWKVDLPIKMIESISSYSGQKGTKLTLGLRFTTVIKLSEELTIRGIFGIKKQTDCLVLALDNPDTFDYLVNRSIRQLLLEGGTRTEVASP